MKEKELLFIIREEVNINVTRGWIMVVVFLCKNNIFNSSSATWLKRYRKKMEHLSIFSFLVRDRRNTLSYPKNVRILCLYYKVTFSKMLNFHTLNFLIEFLILVTTALSNFDRCLLRFAVHKTGVSVMKYFSYWNVIKYFFAWLWVDLFLKVHIKQTAVMFSLLQLSQIRYNLKVHYH